MNSIEILYYQLKDNTFQYCKEDESCSFNCRITCKDFSIRDCASTVEEHIRFLNLFIDDKKYNTLVLIDVLNIGIKL